MLGKLLISNYVLIDRLDIDFSHGFSVLTGETGAGKSIILGALNLLMGQRADVKAIRTGADKCSVEGHFDLGGYKLEALFRENDLDYDEHDTIIRRELNASGKSRAFINDTPVSLAQLKEIGSRLIDIHSQHQNLMLGTEAFQTGVTDAVAGNDALLSTYRESYRALREVNSQLSKLREQAIQSTEEQDFMRFQHDELEKARLADGEQEELEAEQDVLTHAEDIKEALFRASGSLDADEGGALQSIRFALQSMRDAARNLPAAAELAQRLDSSLIELKDISSEVSSLEEETVCDPERLEFITERLDLIYSLEKKHRKDSVGGLLELQKELEAKLSRIDGFDDEIKELTAKREKIFEETRALAAELSKCRRTAALEVEKNISEMLVPLGIPGVRFRIDVNPRDSFDESGADSVSFMFSANKSTELQELSSVASGGELSRVMLSIKTLLAGVRSLPTIVFDEIDTGVSGAVADKMAAMMKGMCTDGRQVIAISHLPQIAAKADAQYRVYKEDSSQGTHTRIGLLDRDERIVEIAKMMSGQQVTDAALSAARTLLDN